MSDPKLTALVMGIRQAILVLLEPLEVFLCISPTTAQIRKEYKKLKKDT